MNERFAMLLAWCIGFICGAIVGMTPFVIRRLIP